MALKKIKLIKNKINFIHNILYIFIVFVSINFNYIIFLINFLLILN